MKSIKTWLLIIGFLMLLGLIGEDDRRTAEQVQLITGHGYMTLTQR